jgi:hypothetical protein
VKKEKDLKKRYAKIANKESKNERELTKLERELVKKLCPKGYLKECEPAYCTFRITDTCPFLKKWREISKGS